MDKHELSDLRNLNVLIIDDQILVHQTLKSAFYELGIHNLKFAENAYYAVRLCEKTHFHVVICAFNVKSDKDGFHLLEELKFKGYVTKCTVLIFLSADTASTLVNSIVELEPDDFWAKPVSIQQVQMRLSHVLEVKQTLFSAYQAFETKQYSKVIYHVERYLLRPELKKYHLMLMRMKGESYLRLLELEVAEKFYIELLEKHKLSWIYIGYAKTLLKQNKIEDIETLLEKMQDKPDTRFATFDLLAQHYIDQQDYEKAYNQIKEAARLSPRNIERQKKLWDLARLNQDHEGQFKATQIMAKVARNSIHDSPSLSLNMIRAGIDYASTLTTDASNQVLVKVSKGIQQLEDNIQDAAEIKEQLVIARARVHNVKNERDLAERLVDTHVSLKSTPSLEDNLDKVKVFHELGKREEALKLLEAVQKQITSDNLTGQVVNCFVEREIETRAEINFTAKQLNEMAIEHFNRSRFGAAAEALLQALVLAPKNDKLMLSLLKVYVTLLRKEGLSEDEKNSSRDVIEQLSHLTLSEKQTKTYKELSEELAEKVQVELPSI